MAKTSSDLASVLEVLMGGKNLSSSLKGSWKGLRIGFVDPAMWQPADFVVEPNESFREQTFTAMDDAAERIEIAGGKLAQPISLISLRDACKESGYEIEDLMTHDFSRSLELFLSHFNDSPVRNLKDLIIYNEEHANLELPEEHPGQQALLGAEASNMSAETYIKALRTMRNTARTAIDKTLSEYNIDAVLGPADARMASLAAVAGYPVASVPLGFAKFNGRAFGMNMIARAGEEAKMLEIMSAWETTFPNACSPPPMLVKWDPEQAASNI